jgi:hypothetical protein
MSKVTPRFARPASRMSAVCLRSRPDTEALNPRLSQHTAVREWRLFGSRCLATARERLARRRARRANDNWPLWPTGSRRGFPTPLRLLTGKDSGAGRGSRHTPVRCHRCSTMRSDSVGQVGPTRPDQACPTRSGHSGCPIALNGHAAPHRQACAAPADACLGTSRSRTLDCLDSTSPPPGGHDPDHSERPRSLAMTASA